MLLTFAQSSTPPSAKPARATKQALRPAQGTPSSVPAPLDGEVAGGVPTKAVASKGDSVIVPSLPNLVRDPTLISTLPLNSLVELRRDIRRLDADIDAAITLRIAEGNHPERQQQSVADRLITPEQAAAQFRVKTRWLLEHASRIPGVRRLSRKTIRFNERQLAAFINRKTA
jgi:hypothetical protein